MEEGKLLFPQLSKPSQRLLQVTRKTSPHGLWPFLFQHVHPAPPCNHCRVYGPSAVLRTNNQTQFKLSGLENVKQTCGGKEIKVFRSVTWRCGRAAAPSPLALKDKGHHEALDCFLLNGAKRSKHVSAGRMDGNSKHFYTRSDRNFAIKEKEHKMFQ